MVDVYKQVTIMGNKRSNKNRCTEEVYNNEDRSDDGVCEEEGDVHDDKEERIDKTCSEKS